MFLVEYDARNFTFEASGATREAAIDALVTGLHIHARQYKIAEDWFMDCGGGLRYREVEEFVRDSCKVREMKPGTCFRDGEQISTKEPR